MTDPLTKDDADRGAEEIMSEHWAWKAIVDERGRQMTEEGWDAAHDDKHSNGEMKMAAMCYLGHVRGVVPYNEDGTPVSWPWGREWWKPKTPERDLVRAGALLLAERDRLTRVRLAVRHIDHKIGIVLSALLAAARIREAQGGERWEASEIVRELRKLEKQGEDYIWRPAKRAADFIERLTGKE